MNLEPGLHITESILLRHRISEGGMGQIWAADHLALHRRVAVKCPSDLLADNAAALRRFAFEAQTLARLQTHHVPQVFDYATLSDGTPCIVMELLDGSEP